MNRNVKNRKSNLTPGIFLELYTLGYIIGKNAEAYGKEILDNINKYNVVWQPSHGIFYPIINDLLKQGLIKCSYEFGAKKYYNITEEGKAYYRDRAEVFKTMLLQSSEFYASIASKLPDKATFI